MDPFKIIAFLGVIAIGVHQGFYKYFNIPTFSPNFQFDTFSLIIDISALIIIYILAYKLIKLSVVIFAYSLLPVDLKGNTWVLIGMLVLIGIIFKLEFNDTSPTTSNTKEMDRDAEIRRLKHSASVNGCQVASNELRSKHNIN